MDPDANLQEQLNIARRIIKLQDGDEADSPGTIEEINHKSGRLAELVLALDSWIRNGGYLPNRWRR